MKNNLIVLLILILGFILRFYNLSSNPPSLYWDEVSLGYNAYSVFTSSIDEHGEFLPKARFIAFGDFKPPGYIYATALSIGIFGMNEFAVRFPSALAGVLLIYFSYLTTFTLIKNRKVSQLCGFLIAISPWAIQLSRGAFEANLGALFSLIGFYLFLKIDRNKFYFMPLSVVFFILSFYTFNANRIISPLILLGVFVYKFSDVIKHKKTIIASIILGVVLLSPSFYFLKSPESKVRFQEVSIFNNLEVLENSNQRIETHNNSVLSKIIYNRRIAYFREFIDHFFDHFKADYLYIAGDKNPRLSTGVVGIFYFFESIFLITGILMILRKRFKEALLIGFCIVVSLLPSSVAKETPHALRTITSMPYFYIILSFGLFYIVLFTKRYLNLRAISFIITSLYVSILIYYLHILFISYPYQWATQWQYGYKQAVEKVNNIKDKYDYVLVSEELGRPYIYFLFYNKIDPKFYVDNRIASRDWFGFWDVDGFEKFRFGMDQLSKLNGKILVVARPSESIGFDIMDNIKTESGEVIFNFGEITK